jgi:DNA polymerase elongation subunit (family B)
VVTKEIDKIITGGDGILQDDLVITKLLRQDIEKYRCLFSHVSAAIRLLNNNGGVDVHRKEILSPYIYTDSQHKNPLCRVVPLEILHKGEKDDKANSKS